MSLFLKKCPETISFTTVRREEEKRTRWEQWEVLIQLLLQYVSLDVLHAE